MFCHECGVRRVEAAKFCGSCGTKLGAPVPAGKSLAELVPSKAASPAAPLAAPSAEVKVLDAGDRFVFSGEDFAQVEKSMQKFIARGAKMITPASKVGRSWMAACSIPPKTKDMSETQTLRLQDVVDAAATAAKAEAEDVDGCRVEEAGFKRIVYGPSLLAVKVRLDRMQHFGAQVIGEIEEQGEEWIAVVDVGSAQDTGFRW